VRKVQQGKPVLEQGIARLRQVAAQDPKAARKIAAAGLATARSQAVLTGIGVGAVLGGTAGAGVTECFWEAPPYYSDCPGSYWYPWGSGPSWYGNKFCFSSGFGGWYWPNGGYACWGPSFSLCWNWGWSSSLCWSTWHTYKPWYYYDCPAVVYSTAYIPYYAPVSVQSVAVGVPVAAYEEANVDAPIGEVVEPSNATLPNVAPAPIERGRAKAPESHGVNSAATRFLELGDAAFRAGRYSDAVQQYARSVENAPDEGVLYLVLADALFATRDWHYAAYALRRAFALEPTLVDGSIDKHGFYADPAEFDRQLAVLELFLKDEPLDADARLVLAANYLFGGRPQATVQLLEAPGSAALHAESATGLLLEAARRAQFERSDLGPALIAPTQNGSSTAPGVVAPPLPPRDT
jgi:hypothetical protein